jgi:flagellar M-ring protein FliF
MDFVSKAVAQILEVLRPMSPPARMTTGLLLVAIVVSLTYLFRTQTDKADGFLFGAQYLSQREIDNMQLAFGAAGLNGSEVEQHRIRVPRSQRADYLAAINAANAYPEHPGAASAQLFASTNALESRDVRERKALRADERDLENVICSFKGVEEAFVEIAETTSRGGIGLDTKRTVLINAKAYGGDYLSDELVKMMRRAGASGIGVEPDKVTVIDTNGRTHHLEGDGTSGENTIYALTQRRREESYRNKIQGLLNMIPGVVVEVFVELDKTLKDQTSTQKYDQPVTITTSALSKETSSTNAAPGGAVGARANLVQNQPNRVSESATENTSVETRDESRNIAGSSHQITELAPLATAYVTASVRVPWSYYERVWRQKNKTPPGEEDPVPPPTELDVIEDDTKLMIEELLKKVIPQVSAGADTIEPITVVTFYETPLPIPEDPGMTEDAASWFAMNWQTIGMFLVALVGVWSLRGMLTASEAESDVVAEQSIPIDSLAVNTPEHDTADEDDEDDLANSLKARFQSSGRSLRDELTELVREDPDAAANVLQNWIGEAA